jgi:hypothetical protein
MRRWTVALERGGRVAISSLLRCYHCATVEVAPSWQHQSLLKEPALMAGLILKFPGLLMKYFIILVGIK